MALNNILNYDNYYNNYILKSINIRQMPKFNLYNIIVKIEIIYKCTLEYAKLLLFIKHNGLFAIKLAKNLKILVK